MIKHLRYGMLLCYEFIRQFAGKRVFKIGEHLAKLRTKWLIVSCAHFRPFFFRRDAELAK